ncbi:MAG: hypothetical protein AAFY08_08780 [Planctomycetota bacterium]
MTKKTTAYLIAAPIAIFVLYLVAGSLWALVSPYAGPRLDQHEYYAEGAAKSYLAQATGISRDSIQVLNFKFVDSEGNPINKLQSVEQFGINRTYSSDALGDYVLSNGTDEEHGHFGFRYSAEWNAYVGGSWHVASRIGDRVTWHHLH